MNCFPKFINKPLQITCQEDTKIKDHLRFDIYLLVDNGLRVAHFKFRSYSSILSKEDQISKITAYFKKKLKEGI